MDSSFLCSICSKRTQDETTVVKIRGLHTLIKKSQEKNDNKWKQWINHEEYRFHDKCRKRYGSSSSKPIPQTEQSQVLSSSFNVPSTSSNPAIQSSECLADSFTSLPELPRASYEFENNFEFDKLCFLCGKNWDRRHKPGIIVQENSLKDRLIAIAAIRENDFGEIISRLQTTRSLTDLKARYHSACYKSFMAPYYKKNKTEGEKKKDTEENGTFDKICNYIESSGEFKFQLSSLKSIMSEDDNGEIETRTLLRNLKKKYGDDIFIFSKQGKETLIYYKYYEFAKICSDWYGKSESLSEMAKKTIITVCAEILQDEIKKTSYNTKTYPEPNKFLDNIVSDIPPLLTWFLQKLLLNDENIGSDECPLIPKVDTIAHSIISALRPKSFISCLQLAVGTYIYRKTGSKLVINLLNKLGVCSSYHNIQLHEASSIIHPQKTIIKDAFVQYVFDNTDHNVSTLDGQETFHCLGGIAVYTPGSSVSYEGTPIKCGKMPSAAQLASITDITDEIYDDKGSSGLQNITYDDPNKLCLGIPPLISPSYITFLSGRCFGIKNLPMWRGFMEKLSENVDFLVSHIKCLPFIRRPPSQFSTLNTALHYAATETRSINQKTTFVTFDQPLYLKARNIVAQLHQGQLNTVVVRLGGFHLLMSYLGAIGSIMAESGLEQLWSVAYAAESVKKMLSGHAFSRAIRAHIISFTALGVIICKNINEYEQFKKIIEDFLVEWPERSPSMKDCESDNNIQKLTELFTEKLSHLENNGPTAKLWIQYFKLVLIALQFIEAERLGNWKLHLQSIKKMLPIFHAAGHYPYAKCAHLYLQDMSKLELIMDDKEYDDYTKRGFFTIRRSQKAWSGVWSDMTIEQTLNRYFGNDLKHGRGVTPSVVTRYLSSMPAAFSIMSTIEQYCNITTLTSEQHVDLTSSRIDRDDADLKNFMYWLDQRNPFIPRDHLISLSTGVIGGPDINCHNAFEKGEEGIKSMFKKTVDEVSLSKVYKVKTLAVAKKGMIANHNNFTTVDSSVLFKRIAVVVKDNVDLLRTALEYELAPFPMSLFDKNGYMRKSNKADLYKIFTPFIQSTVFLDNSHYVIDGGWLLHQVHWNNKDSFRVICQKYLLYIKKHFPAATVVFDGYSNEIVAVKTYERFRRQEKNFAPDLNIEMDMIATLSREKFLANIANKQKFIYLLSDFLKQSEIPVEEADGDADKLIVTTALRLKDKLSQSVVIVGNDIDLFVLLIDQSPQNNSMYFYKMGSGRQGNTLFSTLNNKQFKPFILFAHAFVGCDTTSALYNKGKKKIITLLENDPDLVEMIKTFYEKEQDFSILYKIAETIIFHLYSPGNKKEKLKTLAELRYELFNSSLYQHNIEESLASLPPTTSALQEHTKRVYYQIQEWLGNQLEPENWGWKKLFPAVMFPVMNPTPPAPEELLKSIHCSCQKCDTNRCTCRKSGIHCSEFCRNCEGETCDNRSLKLMENSSADDDRDEGENEVEDEEEEDEELFDEATIDNTNSSDEMDIDFENY